MGTSIKMIMCRYKFLPDDFYLAVSAGVDSVSFAHFLAQKNKQFTIFHFNHKIISEDDEMEKKIILLAKELGISYKIKRNEQDLDIMDEGIESACRKARLSAYKELNKPIVVCHHLNDCIESYFMNWLKGHSDYFPIPIVTELDNNYITRPFLLTTKNSIQRWADRNDLHRFIIHDPMNDDISRMRNWSRHVVLPVIEDRYKGLSKVVRKKILEAYRLTNTPYQV